MEKYLDYMQSQPMTDGEEIRSFLEEVRTEFENQKRRTNDERNHEKGHC